MAITVKHTKVSTVPDDTDTSLVRPSDWNADHALTGVIDVANGGTGAATLTGYVKGNGTSAMTAVATVPSTDITGLGTMSTQNANAVAITGGTINGTTIGATTPAAGTFTTLIGGGSSANYGQLTGGATTKAVEFQTLGSDSNIALVLDTKGTGAIDLAAGSSGVNISNGGTVTSITKTVSGSGYTSFPSIAISAPTTAGGVQATASVTDMSALGTAVVVSGGTGYTNGDILTPSGGTGGASTRITVSAVSGGVITAASISANSPYTALPTNPVSVTGGTGSGATFNLNYAVTTVTLGTAGSGYVEQPTVTFSGGGGGSGATAYVTVGSGTRIQSLGSTLSFYTPNGESFRVVDSGVATAAYWTVYGTGGTPDFRSTGAGTISSTGSNALTFRTNTTVSQFVVAHTASAVDYVQVTGATTASKVVAISAQGSDTDVTLSLSPKGAGTIRFGTYTGTILTPTGYITITDSGGTSRRLLVG